MKLDAKDIDFLVRGSANYKFFKIKDRPIQEPKARLQAVHLRVHRLLSRVAVPAYLHSAVKGKSYLSNALAHDASQPLIKVDIKKFFASVPEDAVVRFLRSDCKCRSDVARLFASMLVCNGKIATGSSASPILAYYAFKSMFDQIATLAGEHGLTFTCYVDDMTLSGPTATNAMVIKVRAIIAKFGLKSHKVRRFNASSPKVVTGVCIMPDGIRVPQKLHLAISRNFQERSTETDTKKREKITASLQGRLDAAGRIDAKFKSRADTFRASTKKAQPSVP
ncbi:hypothetical protein A4A58_12165 [Tardiphaga robiniae]|uniref:Reverse transcriptase domain-containing protein n=2 Tax=Tardiphaga robiniae TaxID=943830 RepID=A0A163Y6F0_9BRAD|nr:hypothetical protein A4A58_12165 [Tardiphaga robiniae]